MKLDSISGLLFFVIDLNKTADFYEALGFKIEKRTPESVVVHLNWFWMEFVAQDKAEKTVFKKESDLEVEQADYKGAGIFVHISVDDVDEFFQSLLVKHMRPSSEPRDWPWGRREFVLRDPDGYKLVFFTKK